MNRRGFFLGLVSAAVAAAVPKAWLPKPAPLEFTTSAVSTGYASFDEMLAALPPVFPLKPNYVICSPEMHKFLSDTFQLQVARPGSAMLDGVRVVSSPLMSDGQMMGLTL